MFKALSNAWSLLVTIAPELPSLLFDRLTVEFPTRGTGLVFVHIYRTPWFKAGCTALGVKLLFLSICQMRVVSFVSQIQFQYHLLLANFSDMGLLAVEI